MRQRRFGRWACVLLASALPFGAAAAQSEFPFDRELLLDVSPMKGSKHVPSIDIGANGAAEIDLWCNTVKAQLVVAGDTITVITGPVTERACPPERLQADQDMMTALSEVTNWRREGDALILSGGKTLRFRLQTN